MRTNSGTTPATLSNEKTISRDILVPELPDITHYIKMLEIRIQNQTLKSKQTKTILNYATA